MQQERSDEAIQPRRPERSEGISKSLHRAWNEGHNMTTHPHEHFMRIALALAEHARANHEVPVGAVVVRDYLVIGEGFNQPISLNDPTAHAEIVALRAACTAIGNYRLPGCSLYVTVEPCIMCAGAIVQARVPTVVFGARDPKAGAAGSIVDLLQMPLLNHRARVVAGVCREECAQTLRTFFEARRSKQISR